MDRGITSGAQTAPGAAVIADLLTRLATVEIAGDDDRGLVDVVGLCERLKGAAAAVQARATVQFLDRRVAAADRVLADVGECRPPRADQSGGAARAGRSRGAALADRSARAELALARRCSPSVMDRQVGVAKALTAEMPATMGLLTVGRISEGQAFAMVARTACLTREDRAGVDALLPAAFAGPATADGPGAESVGCGDLAHLPGYGVLPAADIRARITALLDDNATETNAGALLDDPTTATSSDGAAERRRARIWLRRLFTSPDGRDLVAMDSHRRTFTGSLRQFLELRDPTCRVPYCDAPAIHLDHATGHAHGARTTAAEGNGQCAAHNQIKEEPGWRYRIINDGLDPGPHHQPHELHITTPTGREYRTRAAPLHGWGSRPDSSAAPTASPAATVDTAFPITDHLRDQPA